MVALDKILIIEDDDKLAEGLCRALSSDLVAAESCGLVKDARRKLSGESFTLVLLDVNLPDGNGFDLLREIKETYGIKVIMLTANDMESDIVSGLEQGADDYITKPFSLAVLRARVNTQLRKGMENNSRRFVNNGFVFDFDRMEFTVQGVSVQLSKTEQKLLHILTDNAGVTVSREKLIDRIWTDGAEYVDENALSVTVNRLRSKLGAQGIIKTVYGIGYMWERQGG